MWPSTTRMQQPIPILKTLQQQMARRVSGENERAWVTAQSPPADPRRQIPDSFMASRRSSWPRDEDAQSRARRCRQQ